MRKIYLTTLVLIFGFCATIAQTPEQLFTQANNHYANGRYAEALKSYEQILNKHHQESAALYYNMANSYYKLNKIAPTIFYFEKAKQLDPLDTEIKTNATFAQNMKIDTIDPLPENTIQKWVDSLLNTFTTDGWAYSTIGAILLFVILYLAFSFSATTAAKRLYFITSISALVICLISISFAFSSDIRAKKNNPAIVFAAEVQIKSEPNLGSSLAFTLHEGTKVQVLEKLLDWSKIKISDGKTGWIPSADIKLLNDI